MEEDETAKSSQFETSNHPFTPQPYQFNAKTATVADNSRDGAVLRNEEDTFSDDTRISPIPKTGDKLHQTLDEGYDGYPDDSLREEAYRESVKRKRIEDDSIDNISMMSVDSTKKPKLLRAGSLTKNLRRRMSFGIVQPINNLFRQRRNSADPNNSTCSNFETTFNESIKEPFKEKFRQIKDKVCKLSKKDLTTPKSTKAKIRMASANLTCLKEVCNLKTNFGSEITTTPEKTPQDFGVIEFKTPKALPFPFSSSSMSRSMHVGAKLEESLRNIETASEILNATVDMKLVFICH